MALGQSPTTAPDHRPLPGNDPNDAVEALTDAMELTRYRLEYGVFDAALKQRSNPYSPDTTDVPFASYPEAPARAWDRDRDLLYVHDAAYRRTGDTCTITATVSADQDVTADGTRTETAIGEVGTAELTGRLPHDTAITDLLEAPPDDHTDPRG